MALKGLTAQDRANWEKKYASQLKGKDSQWIENAWINWNFDNKYKGNKDFSTLKTMKVVDKEKYWNDEVDKAKQSYVASPEELSRTYKDSLVQQSDVTSLPLTHKVVQSADDLKMSAEYIYARNKAADKYGVKFEKDYLFGRDWTQNILKIAEQTSPYYRKYRGTDKLPFTDDDWRKLALDYLVEKEINGEESANALVLKRIQDTVNENTGLLERLWNGFKTMGADATASTISLLGGLAVGTYNFFTGEHLDIEGASGFTNFVDAILDNDVTRYANDIMQYGSLIPSELERAKEIGLSDININQSYDQATGNVSVLEEMFNENTVANLVGQYGFTLASMLQGGAASKLTQGSFKLLKGATMANRMRQTGLTAYQLRNTLTRIQKAENFVNRTIIPGIVGTGEGMMEGLLTKMDFMEDGKKFIAEKQAQEVLTRFEALMQANYQRMFDEAKALNGMGTPTLSAEFGRGVLFAPMRTDEEIQQDIVNQLYKQAWDSFGEEYESSLDLLEYAATKAGVTNFMINSVINGGINATLKSNIFLPKTQQAIKTSRLGKIFTPKPKFSVDASGKVVSKLPWYKQAWNFIKEPTGEATEEALQTLSDKYSQGVAASNIANFTQHKYSGEAVEIGETWANDLMAGMKAIGEALTDREMYINAFYGFASSVLGGVNAPHRARRANGEKGGLFNPMSYFTKGINEAGLLESTMEMIARLTPWRSGVVQAYKDNKALKERLKNEVEMLLNWIDDPLNKAKFDGLSGTFSWAKDIQESADNNDEFGYRNSVLGKTINDVMMLQKLKGTQYYDSFIEQLNEAANLTSDSKTALDYIKSMRNGLATKAEVENMTDEQILDLVKKNANSMLNKMDEILEASDKLETLLGNIDIDTKEALVYGELQLKDWNERGTKLEQEIKEYKFTDSTERSNLSKEAKALIARYGSITKAFAERDKLKKNVAELTQNVTNMSKRKNLNSKEKEILNKQKQSLSLAKKALRKFDGIKDIELTDQVLSENEIMELDPITRANMLNPDEKGRFSEAQQAVIDNILNTGNSTNTEFINKVRDSARIRKSSEYYSMQYNAILSDPQIFNAYVLNAKIQATKALYKKRYDKLTQIQDYKEFARLMDKLMIDGTPLERQTIESQFRRDEQKIPEGVQSNYSKYIEQRKQIAEIARYASKSAKVAELQGNDIDMLTHAISYLTEQEIDLNDETAVVNALSEVNEQGKNKFQQYVEDINLNAEETTKTEFVDLEGTILNVRSLLKDYLKDSKEQADNYTPITVETPANESNTTTAPTIFDVASLTLEEANQSLQREHTGTLTDGTTITETGLTVPQQPKQASNNTQLSSYVANYELNSTNEVLNAARNVEYLTLKGKLNSEQQLVILDILNALSNNIYTTAEDFVDDLTAQANKLDTEKGDTVIAQSLRDYALKVKQDAIAKKQRAKRIAETQAANQIAALSKSPLLQKALGYATLDVRNSNNMSTVDIDWMKKTFSINPNEDNYSPLLEYIEQNKVEEFLKNNELTRDTPVFFVYDPVLANKLKEVYEKGGFAYSNANTALIAVVESDKGTIEINGKKYQPIGVMPSSGAKNTLGSNRVEKVRNKIQESASAPYILSDALGVIETRLSNHIYAKPMQQQYTNVPIFDGMMNDMTSDERLSMENTPIELRKINPIYQAKKRNILARIVLNTQGAAHLELNVNNLMGGITPIRLFVQEISSTRATNKDATIVDMLRSDDIDVLNANSRIRRWAKDLGNILNVLNDDIVLSPTGEVTKESQAKIDAISKTLNDKLSNYLYPNGYKYSIQLEQTVDGVHHFSISMTNGSETIHLGAFDSTGITELQKLDILKNMVLQGNDVRMTNSKNCLVKWQVNYRDFASNEKAAKDNVSDIFDDNILETAKKNLTYQILGITLEAPYTMEGLKREFALVANKDNASTNVTTGETRAANGAVIDTDSGTVVSGKTPVVNNEAVNQAVNIGKQITQDSSQFTKTDNGWQVNGTEFLDIDGYTSDLQEHLTTIKSIVKSIFDSVFSGVTDSMADTHPNMTKNAYNNFTATITQLKNRLTADGITFIPNTVVTWQNGDVKLSQLVYLGYDLNGNWHAYCPLISNNITDEDKKVFAEQISMMTATLAKQNNIAIKDFTVLPIAINYPNAKVEDIHIRDNQVIINKKAIYSGTSPRLMSAVTYQANDITSYTSVLDKIGSQSNEPINEETIIEEVPELGIEDSFSSDVSSLFGEDFGTPDTETPYVNNSLTWGVFEGRGLNVEQTMENLKSQGITEEQWNNMSEDEREHELECKGVL